MPPTSDNFTDIILTYPEFFETIHIGSWHIPFFNINEFISAMPPVWLWLLLTPGLLFITYQMVLTFFNFLSPLEETGDNSRNYPYWIARGKAIKQAYAAKFNGMNPAFNKEVDSHVRVMMHNGRGITRSLAKDWLKRMGKFTEV